MISVQNEEQLINRLETVLKVAKDFGLEINKEKCQFVLIIFEFLKQKKEICKTSLYENKAVMNFLDPNNTK